MNRHYIKDVYITNPMKKILNIIGHQEHAKQYSNWILSDIHEQGLKLKKLMAPRTNENQGATKNLTHSRNLKWFWLLWKTVRQLLTKLTKVPT